MDTLKLAIPSKGRLRDLTSQWFAKMGIKIATGIGTREYSVFSSEMPRVEIMLLSAGEIPKELAAGRIDLGITGQDLVREKNPIWSDSALELKRLSFGKADLVLAVPKFWVDVDSLDDFDAVAINFRKKNGFRLRIATKYHNLVWAYLRKMGIADYQLIDSQGATEGTVKNNSAEAIADISSSGETLEANHLKVIGDAPILSSQATLYLSYAAEWSLAKRKILEDFCSQLGIASPRLSGKPEISILTDTEPR